jgi:hypothetical protein
VLIGQLRHDHIDIDAYLGQAANSSAFLQARTRIWNVLHKSPESDGDGSSGRLDVQR